MNIQRAAVINEAIAQARAQLQAPIEGETPAMRAHRLEQAIVNLTQVVELNVLATLTANSTIKGLKAQNEQMRRLLMVVADRFGGLKIRHEMIEAMNGRQCEVRRTPEAIVFEMKDGAPSLTD